MPGKVTQVQIDNYWKLRANGANITQAAKAAGFSRTYASQNLEKGNPTSSGTLLAKYRSGVSDTVAPIPYDELSAFATSLLADFGKFRYEVMGHWSEPWQEAAAHRTIEYLESPEDTYLVSNMPPGAGKTTLFTHDIPAWLIARDRTIRMLLGSRTLPQARRFVARLKRTLERPTPVVGANHCMSTLFGRFKPDEPDLWRGDEFIVEQFGGVAIGEKEATAVAAAQQSGFLGGRYDHCVWDDLVDRKNSRTAEQREELQEWWKLEAETRLEPGGLLHLLGQRIAPEDLYRYSLDMVSIPDDVDEGELDEAAISRLPRKYIHIVYKAHYEEHCAGDHGRDARSHPDGCLLSPRRLSYRKLATAKENDPTRFAITYQQEDVDEAGQLVQDIWLTGGTDRQGVLHPGCYDYDRNICQLPDGLEGPLISVATIDPSPESWWGIQWWVYDCATDRRFLMDLHRAKMSAPQLLDRLGNGEYVGLAEEWQKRSVDLGWPISHWIIERAAAQRFMYQYDFWQRWIARWSVDLMPHDTGLNKADPDYGVQSIAPHYRYGRVRLPYMLGFGRTATTKLATELMRWSSSTDKLDQVMANWFFEYHIQNLKYAVQAPPQRWVPSWLSRTPRLAGSFR